MAALDKNATSMRVLLHDTHANFERFTSQVGNLFETIQETKNDLKTMQSLFQRDRETLTGDIVDLGNWDSPHSPHTNYIFDGEPLH